MNNFLTALVQKLVTFLNENHNFFELKESEKSKKLESLSVPVQFKQYLEKADANSFMLDLKVVVQFIQDSKNAVLKENSFFKALLKFITEDLARKIDHLDGNFYLLPKQERVEIVDKLINADSQLAETLKEILTNFTYQQIANEIQELGKRIANTPYILVQSPREIDNELKKDIRMALSKENPLSFPTFQINRKLIGGIRVFQDGKVKDHSWISRVLRFTSLTAN
ncbi:hypothetical protein COU74_01200 [Candidatus Peregrinibacteria bacterium CG10_big_fil_rev_8_21_14_0_10_36_19]|nr:MAG: hypothetical protein COU74_01200 [Candidatus Peregrinibacteria bacterium CG10_big_fil_rev_8_21_14_0_10_36_19]